MEPPIKRGETTIAKSWACDYVTGLKLTKPIDVRAFVSLDGGEFQPTAREASLIEPGKWGVTLTPEETSGATVAVAFVADGAMQSTKVLEVLSDAEFAARFKEAFPESRP